MTIADAIQEALGAKGIPSQRAAEEPDVVVIASVGSLWGTIDEDGRLRLSSLSRKYKNDWGSAHQRHVVIDDATNTTAIAEAVHELYDGIR